MKILNIVTQPQWRGAEMFALDFKRALNAKGLEARNLYLYKPPQENDFPIEAGDIALEYDASTLVERVTGINPALLRALSAIVKRERPDVIQLHGDRSNKYGALLKISGAFKGRLVGRIIGDPLHWLKTPLSRILYSRIFASMDGVVTLSLQAHQAFQRLVGAPIPAAVIPNGSDFKRLANGRADLSLEKAREAMVLLFVGTLDRNKRADRFIKIVEALNAPGAGRCFGWIVGDGPERNNLEALVAGRQLASVISFFGYRSDVVPFYKQADLLVLTSDSEGIPAVVLEAAYLALPVIASNVGGISECVRNNETGFLLPPGEVDSFVQCVRGLDENRRRQMGDAAHRFVAGKFSIQTITEQHLDFYASISS